HFEPLVSQAHAPGATMVPAPSALLRVLVLTRLDKARRRHINDFTCDAAGGLCAGLHGPPQTSSATAYASRTGRDHQQKFLSGWIGAVAPVWCPHAHPCSLDFPPLPFRGDATGLEQPSLPRRGKAGTSGRSFLAHEPTSPGVCAANAHLPRRAQADEALQCVALWPALTGGNPQWRSLSFQAVPQPALSQPHQRRLLFLSPSRGGPRRPRQWRQAVIATPHRRHPRSRYLAETGQLPGDQGALRHLAVTGLGRERPPLCLSNHATERARARMVR